LYHLRILPCNFTFAPGDCRNRADGCGSDGVKSAGRSGTRAVEPDRQMIPFVRLRA